MRLRMWMTAGGIALLSLGGACSEAVQTSAAPPTAQTASPTTAAAAPTVAATSAAQPAMGAAGSGSSLVPPPAMPALPAASAANPNGAANQGSAGSGAMLPGAMAEVGGASAPAAPERPDLGKGDGKDVVTIGDSYMSLNAEGVEPSLDKIAGVMYRHYAVMGTQLANGQIPSQYDQAKRESADIKTIVMTGGGNDFLQNGSASSDCSNVGPNCSAVLDKIRMTMNEMWTKMSADNVQDVFLLTYPPTPMTTLGPAFESVYAKLMQDCAMVAAPLHCHVVNATPAFDGRTRELIRGDNIHPTGEGFDILAKLVYDTMEQSGARR